MKVFVLVFLIILSFNLFSQKFIDFPSAIPKIAIILASVFGYLEFRNYKMTYKRHLLLILVFLMFSCISSAFYREQSVFRTFVASDIVYSLFLYFFFWKVNPSDIQTSKIIVSVSILYCAIYIFQYFNVGKAYFYNIEETERLGVAFSAFRLRIAGTAAASLGCFYGINCYLKTAKLKWLPFSFWGLIVIFLMGFRTLIVASLLCILFMVLNYKGVTRKTFRLLGVLGLIIFVFVNTPYAQAVLADMSNRQETDSFANQDYSRVVGFVYYTNHYFKDGIEYFFGSGLPYSGSTNEVLIKNKLLANNAVWVDWGIVGLSWYVGIITVLLVLALLLNLIFKNIGKDQLYLRYWLIFILLSSVTSGEFIRTGNTVIVAFVLFLIDKYNQSLCDISCENND